jgi:hypothetical protein
MKAMMILGAVIGFFLGVVSSISGDCTASTVFWHASVTALVGSLLARWWGRLWFINLADTLEQQRRLRTQAALESKPGAKL